MPIQVPSLKRFNVQNEPSVGRLEVKPVDVQKGQAVQTEAANRLAGTISDYIVKEQRNAAHTAGISAANDYHRILENKLEGPEGAKRKSGDPAPIYAQFDSDAKAAYDEILKKYEGANEQTKESVKARLADTYSKFYDRRTTAYGAQESTYRNGIVNDSVKNSQNDLMHSTAYLDIKDEKTLIPIDSKLDEILDTHTKNGLIEGTVTKDEKGNYIYNASVQQKIAKSRSDALIKGIDNLTSMGKVEEAKFLQEKYAPYIDNASRTTLNKRIAEESINVQGLKEFDKVRNLPFETAMKKLDSLPIDLKVKQKAMEHLDTNQRRLENASDRQSKQNMMRIAQVITAKEQSGNPFVDTNDMLNDPIVKNLIPRVNANQIKTLKSMVKPPTESDSDAQVKMYDLVFNPTDYNDGNGLKGMKPEEFLEYRKGLSKKDQNYLDQKYKEINTVSTSQDIRRDARMGTILKDELVEIKSIAPNQYGRFEGLDFERLNKARKELSEALEHQPPMSPNEEKKFIVEFSAKYAKANASKSWSDIFSGGKSDKLDTSIEKRKAPKEVDTSSTPGSTNEIIDKPIKIKAIIQWKKSNPDRDPDYSPGSKDVLEIENIYKSLLKKSGK